MANKPNRQKVETIKETGETRDTAPLRGWTPNQSAFITAIQSSPITIGIGPAGTGKTYIAASVAADMLVSKQVESILITRPAVEAGEKLGFLPGDINEKFDPYFMPVRDVLNRRLGRSYVDCLIRNDRVKTIPLAYMRGHTFNNCFMILDEAQNATPDQVKLFLTRIGKFSRVVISGDTSQKDIRGMDGLSDAAVRLAPYDIMSMVHFDSDDVVRSGIAKIVVEAYS